MGTQTVEMSEPEQARAIGIARELAKEFARIGALYDAQNEFPMELVPRFKESGLAGLVVPKAYGGMGGDIWTVTRVAIELAKGDPACALSFNMHFTMVGILRALLGEEAKRHWLRQIAIERKILCGPFSEERAGIIGLADTVAIPTKDGGFRIRGGKTWGTLSQASDIISFNATISDEDGVPPADFTEHAAREFVFILPMSTPGIRIEETWDAMGMRATGTHTVLFEDVAAPKEARVATFRGGLLGEFEWAALTFSGVYVGLAFKAYEETRAILRKKSLGATQAGGDVALKGLGYVQHGLGKMLIANEASARTLEATCRMLLEGRDAEWHPAARIAMLDVAKVVSTENAIEVVSAGMRLVGGSTYRRGHVLERLYRDSRSGPFHPLTTDQAADLLGKVELGLLDPPA